jgi:hypothetical protein
MRLLIESDSPYGGTAKSTLRTQITVEKFRQQLARETWQRTNLRIRQREEMFLQSEHKKYSGRIWLL